MHIVTHAEASASTEAARLKECREYFEQGCLCLARGDIQKAGEVSDKAAIAHYESLCRCSRNYGEGQMRKPDEMGASS